MQGTGGVSGSQAAGNSAKTNTNAVSLRDLQKQYPHLKLSAQSFSSTEALKDYAMQQSGKYNVAIDPRAIARMGEDEAFASKIHEALAGVKDGDDWLENQINSRPGSRMIACGTVIDKDGNVNGWAVGVTTTSTEGAGVFDTAKRKEELAERVEAKRKKREEEAERLEKNKEAKKAQAERLEVDVSLEVTATNAAVEQPERSGLDVKA